MASSILLLSLSVLLFFLSLCIPMAQTDDTEVPYPFSCGIIRNYTKGSTYANNLDAVRKTLVKNISDSGFLATEVGESPDVSYGLAQCRGDIAASPSCPKCLQNMIEYLGRKCPISATAMVWSDDCLVHHSGKNFTGYLSGDFFAFDNCSDQKVNDTNIFTDETEELLERLTNLTTNGSSGLMFAAGSTKNSSPLQLSPHGLTQCTYDIVPNDCKLCLQNLNSYLIRYCNSSQRKSFYTDNCWTIVDVKPFYGHLPPPPPPPSPPPAKEKVNKGKVAAIVLLAIGVSVLIVFIIACYFRRRKIMKAANGALEMKANHSYIS